jgi:hypothetical protein
VTPLAQLELDLLSAPDASPPRVVASAVLRRHRLKNGVLRRVEYVRRFIPELDGETITVGITRAASGMAIPGGTHIWLNPSRLSHHTIAHELVHLLQKRHLGIPSGEKACDIYALARHWTLNDDRPSYVRVPVDLADEHGRFAAPVSRWIYDVAVEALARRAGGRRHYIAFFECTMETRR